MTKDQAIAFCQLLHIQMGNNGYAFYATASLFGHDLQTTSGLADSAYKRDGVFGESAVYMHKKAAALFRDMAEALEK